MTFATKLHYNPGMKRKGPYRLTLARKSIVQILKKASRPVDAAYILDQLRGKGLKADRATVFRNLLFLTHKDTIRKIVLDERRACYELHALPHHHHVVCKKCKKIKSVDLCGIEIYIKRIERQMRFKIDSHMLEFFGYCNACVPKES